MSLLWTFLQDLIVTCAYKALLLFVVAFKFLPLVQTTLKTESHADRFLLAFFDVTVSLKAFEALLSIMGVFRYLPLVQIILKMISHGRRVHVGLLCIAERAFLVVMCQKFVGLHQSTSLFL